jgi:hypothetical protein
LKTRHIIIAVVVAFLGIDAIVVGAVWKLTHHRRLQSQSQPAPVSSVSLTGTEGRRYLGEQLQFFVEEGNGVLSVTNPAFLTLYHTEGKAFQLAGEVWLGESEGRAPIPDLPDGFALFIREWDSLHRYSLRTRSMEVKRRQREGLLENGIKQVVSFRRPDFGAWIPFTANVSAEQISFQIGDQSGVIGGPLDMDGANKVARAPGTKLKNLRLEILDSR